MIRAAPGLNRLQPFLSPSLTRASENSLRASCLLLPVFLTQSWRHHHRRCARTRRGRIPWHRHERGGGRCDAGAGDGCGFGTQEQAVTRDQRTQMLQAWRFCSLQLLADCLNKLSFHHDQKNSKFLFASFQNLTYRSRTGTDWAGKQALADLLGFLVAQKCMRTVRCRSRDQIIREGRRAFLWLPSPSPSPSRRW